MNETEMKKKPNLDERIFLTIKENPTITREELAKKMGISLQRVRERVSVLKKKKLLSEVKVLVPVNQKADIEVH